MSFRSVTFVLLFVTCVYAAPAPRNPKFTLVKDSSVGLGVAGIGGKAQATVVEKEKSVEVPFPGDTGGNIPDVTVVENVHYGTAIAFANSISNGVNANNIGLKDWKLN